MEKISEKSENTIDTNSGCPIKKLKLLFKNKSEENNIKPRDFKGLLNEKDLQKKEEYKKIEVIIKKLWNDFDIFIKNKDGKIFLSIKIENIDKPIEVELNLNDVEDIEYKEYSKDKNIEYFCDIFLLTFKSAINNYILEEKLFNNLITIASIRFYDEICYYFEAIVEALKVANFYVVEINKSIPVNISNIDEVVEKSTNIAVLSASFHNSISYILDKALVLKKWKVFELKKWKNEVSITEEAFNYMNNLEVLIEDKMSLLTLWCPALRVKAENWNNVVKDFTLLMIKLIWEWEKIIKEENKK